MLRPRAYSPSRLTDFDHCPRKYYWRYVVKAPRKPRAARQTGIFLHEALEKLIRAGHQQTDDPKVARQVLTETWRVEAFADATTAEQELQAAASLLVAHLERVREAEAHTEPVLLEARLKGTIAGLPFVGVVDRVNRRRNGSLELVDYKSGHTLAQENSPQVLLQLAVYRELVRSHTGQWPEAVSILHVREGNRPVELSPSEWNAHTDRAVALAHALATEENFDARPGSDCEHCDYASRCIPYMHWQANPASIS